MTLKTIVRPTPMLLAIGLVVGVAAAQAAGGYTVERGQEAQVAPGMSAADVQGAIGQPAHNVKYGNEPGATWTYNVAGADETVFDVDFGADGKVASVGERVQSPD